MKLKSQSEVILRLKQCSKLLQSDCTDETKLVLRVWIASLKWYLGIFTGRL
jgi:hypothetical protein